MLDKAILIDSVNACSAVGVVTPDDRLSTTVDSQRANCAVAHLGDFAASVLEPVPPASVNTHPPTPEAASVTLTHCHIDGYPKDNLARAVIRRRLLRRCSVAHLLDVSRGTEVGDSQAIAI